MNIQELAKDAQKYFTRKSDEDSYKIEFDAPDWVHDVWKNGNYNSELVLEALCEIADCENTDDINMEPDVYSSDRLKWFNDSNGSIDYCNQAISEFGLEVKDIMELIGYGQYLEKNEVLQSVISSLNERLEELEEQEEEQEQN